MYFVTVGTACSPERYPSLPAGGSVSVSVVKEGVSSPHQPTFGGKPSSVTFVPAVVFVVFQREQKCSGILLSSFSENPLLSPRGLAFCEMCL